MQMILEVGDASQNVGLRGDHRLAFHRPRTNGEGTSRDRMNRSGVIILLLLVDTVSSWNRAA
jgi:hypothetical protein